MTKLALSNDLNVITAEINSYKQIAGQAVFEIGKRLKHVKEHDLAHGEWIEWLETIDISHSTAKRMVQAYEQFQNSATSHHLNTSKIFEMLSLPESVDREEFIQQQHVIPSTGESKTVDDMTVRELREVKKSLKEAHEKLNEYEHRAQQAEVSKEIALKQQALLQQQIEELQQKSVRSPEDQERLNKLSAENNQLLQTINQLQDELLERTSSLENKAHELRKMKECLKKTEAYVLSDLSAALMHFQSVYDQKEAIDFAERFWRQLDETIQKQRSKWQQFLEINISEVNHDEEETFHRSTSTRAPIIFDAN